jgi:hypothetical protein
VVRPGYGTGVTKIKVFRQCKAAFSIAFCWRLGALPASGRNVKDRTSIRRVCYWAQLAVRCWPIGFEWIDLLEPVAAFETCSRLWSRRAGVMRDATRAQVITWAGLSSMPSRMPALPQLLGCDSLGTKVSLAHVSVRGPE